MKIRTITAILLAVAVAGCWHEEEWTGFVYPNGADLTKHIEIGTFSNFAECQVAAQDKLELSGWASRGDYECGLNCKMKAEYGGLFVCEETAK